MSVLRSITFLMVIALLFQCQSKKLTFQYRGHIKSGSWLTNIKVEYTAQGQNKFALAQIYFPKNYIKGKNFRTLIGLHSHQGSYRDWERHTSIENYADMYNFIIVCPNMGNTIYETEYFPETTNKWNGIPGGRWIVEILIPYLQENFAICLKGNRIGIFGNSTGGRGALLLAASYPHIFGAAAGLSGDYDPISMPNDRLLTSVYGNFKDFRARWEKKDNIIKLAVNLHNIPVFIAHGEKDMVVPFEQSRILAIRLLQLRKNSGEFILEYHLKKYKFHDWSFWGIMTPQMMSFFNEYLKEPNKEK
jgi:putative tributyrin esterase